MAKTDAEIEEARRAALSPAERDAEDLARMEEEERLANDRDAGRTSGADSLGKAALVKRIQERNRKERAKLATVEVTIAPGREIFTEPGQLVPHTGGTTLVVTPEEEASLRAAGHLINPDRSINQPEGPRVYQEAGLLQGHQAGQGAGGDKGGKGGGKSK